MARYKMYFDTEIGLRPFNVDIEADEILNSVLPDILIELEEFGYVLKGWPSSKDIVVIWEGRELSLADTLIQQRVRENDILRVAVRCANDVLDKPEPEQKKRKKQQVIAKSKHGYIVALLFASIFIASTANLFIIYKSFTHPNPLSSDITIWITVFTAIVSAIGTFSTIILAWRSYRRDAREKELKIAQLERELAASSEKPALSRPNGKRNRKKNSKRIVTHS
jgi:hypothetical protein